MKEEKKMSLNLHIGDLIIAGDADSHQMLSNTGVLPDDRRRSQSQQANKNMKPQCANAREIDIAELQTRAFRDHKMVLINNNQISEED